ncbi:MAG: glycosyltransferase family 4 protein [Candidatus Cloacimonetes bacterium]|nr:glycosyltransferase family 4 protein [Candidatus Cloacimonadota bacterium]
MKKLTVVWICHFSNALVQEKLKPWKKKAHFAPWISQTIPIFENHPDIQLHIIAPHEYISGSKEFTHKGVHYHFFNPYIPIWGRHWPGFFKWDEWTNYAYNKKVVKSLIQKIAPDVIHLQGAENPYYSSTILPLLGLYPIVINLQRVLLSFLNQNNKRAIIEKDILDKARNISIRTETMKSDISSYRPDANIHWVRYQPRILEPLNLEKEYDVVFFARVSKAKGIEDLIDAMGIVAKTVPSPKLCIIGGISDVYKTELTNRAAKLNLAENITWKGYLHSVEDVYREASKAKISVLPTHNDIIPGTIIESMQLGLPVVSYKVGSIPELNVDEGSVLLSELGDIQGLARNMTKLLTDAVLYDTMSARGIICIQKRYSGQDVLKQHLDCYQDVIWDYEQQRHQ